MRLLRSMVDRRSGWQIGGLWIYGALDLEHSGLPDEESAFATVAVVGAAEIYFVRLSQILSYKHRRDRPEKEHGRRL